MRIVSEKVIEADGMNIHLVESKKFKTISIVAKFIAPLAKETITKRALLPFVLRQGTKSYPTRAELQGQLDGLYGAVLSIDGGKKGDQHILSVRLEVANDKFIGNASGLFEDAIQLFKEIIFEPNVKEDHFDEAIFAREKETLREQIKSVIDDKMGFAQMRLIDEMCADESYALHVEGYEADLDQLTSAELYRYYQSVLETNFMDIYVVGDFEADVMEKQIHETLTRKIYISEPKANEEAPKQITEVKEVIEKQDIQQAKLHLGYRTHTRFKDADYAALQVFNGIFGGFPSSKLFINVREKNSLAYYAASRIESHKGLLFVFSGIAGADYNKARSIIELQMRDMRAGSFSETDLSETKDLIINQFLETLDSAQGVIEVLYQQQVAGIAMPPVQIIENLQKVTTADVIAVANKIEEDTVYLLTSEGGENLE